MRNTHETVPTPFSRPRISAKNLAFSVGRHALPLIFLYALHGSITSYLLLTAFDLSLGLLLIVATTRDKSDPTSVDPRSRMPMMQMTAILALTVFLGGMAALICVPIGIPAVWFGFAEGVEWSGLLLRPGFLAPLFAMSLLAAVKAQSAFEATTTPGPRGPASQAAPVIGDLAADRRNSLAANAAQVTLIATFVLLCYLLSALGSWSYRALPPLYAAVLAGYDLRPDLAQRLFPSLWKNRKG